LPLHFLDFSSVLGVSGCRKPHTFCQWSLLSPDSEHMAPRDLGQVHTGKAVSIARCQPAVLPCCGMKEPTLTSVGLLGVRGQLHLVHTGLLRDGIITPCACMNPSLGRRKEECCGGIG
jgi:hypothetical protein